MMSFERVPVTIGLVIVLFICSCSSDYQAEVESDTSWSGDFAGIRVDGSGNQSFDIPDEGYQCCVVQKNTPGGYLKLRVYDASTGSGDSLADPEVFEETTEAYGHITWCVDAD
jgi:hypothetical protein